MRRERKGMKIIETKIVIGKKVVLKFRLNPPEGHISPIQRPYQIALKAGPVFTAIVS